MEFAIGNKRQAKMDASANSIDKKNGLATNMVRDMRAPIEKEVDITPTDRITQVNLLLINNTH